MPQRSGRTQTRSAKSRLGVLFTCVGRRVELVKTGGNSRELGRQIVQTTGGKAGKGHSAKLNSIPITVVST